MQGSALRPSEEPCLPRACAGMETKASTLFLRLILGEYTRVCKDLVTGLYFAVFLYKPEKLETT